MDIEDIRRGLLKAGKTQRGLAKALKLDDAAITRMLKGERQIKAPEVAIIRAYLEEPAPELGETLNSPPRIANLGILPRDVPIMGVTVGGLDGDFAINVGDKVDYAPRHPPVARNGKVFALYVQGVSMRRWREPGQLVYLDPARPARPGDHVVVECHPEREGEGHPGYLKEFVAKTGTKLRLLQYNPESTIEIPLARVIAIYRVIEWEELLGSRRVLDSPTQGP